MTTPAEAYYIGQGGRDYWKRNTQRCQSDAIARRNSLRNFVGEYRLSRWLEVGCGIGANMFPGDIGLDCDPRPLSALTPDKTGVIGHAYNLPFPDAHFPVVFSVGCLMHLPSCENGDSVKHGYCATWQGAVQEMARVSAHFVLIGEYIEPEERDLHWQDRAGLCWARPYTVPGFRRVKKDYLSPPFDPEVDFELWEKG